MAAYGGHLSSNHQRRYCATRLLTTTGTMTTLDWPFLSVPTTAMTYTPGGVDGGTVTSILAVPLALSVIVGAGIGISGESPSAGTITADVGFVVSRLSNAAIETVCPGRGVGLVVVASICAGGGGAVVVVKLGTVVVVEPALTTAATVVSFLVAAAAAVVILARKESPVSV
jgi:hypothetical protein